VQPKPLATLHNIQALPNTGGNSVINKDTALLSPGRLTPHSGSQTPSGMLTPRRRKMMLLHMGEVVTSRVVETVEEVIVEVIDPKGDKPDDEKKLCEPSKKVFETEHTRKNLDLVKVATNSAIDQPLFTESAIKKEEVNIQKGSIELKATDHVEGYVTEQNRTSISLPNIKRLTKTMEDITSDVTTTVTDVTTTEEVFSQSVKDVTGAVEKLNIGSMVQREQSTSKESIELPKENLEESPNTDTTKMVQVIPDDVQNEPISLEQIIQQGKENDSSVMYQPTTLSSHVQVIILACCMENMD
jgi:hypothetical protein